MAGCAGSNTWFGSALRETIMSECKLAQRMVVIMRAQISILAAFFGIIASMSALGDEPSASDRTAGTTPATASTFGGIRRSGNAQQVPTSSSDGTATGVSQATRSGASAATSAIRPGASEKTTALKATARRAAIPPPRQWTTSGDRPSNPSSDIKLKSNAGTVSCRHGLAG